MKKIMMAILVGFLGIFFLISSISLAKIDGDSNSGFSESKPHPGTSDVNIVVAKGGNAATEAGNASVGDVSCPSGDCLKNGLYVRPNDPTVSPGSTVGVPNNPLPATK